ncbi:lysophospholipid acyltransferase family protein [Nitrosophilus alvini]|uniref:lysophospholipid acyltransferase family protein n=1 Tax=Nitrosophilus alvini TaxID=2714855 RepID=UPI00190C856E|nr:lysophospholipid acyltransferase family protein [Nitrosophilus alvini]
MHKDLKRRFLSKIFPSLGYLIIKGIYLTCKKEYVIKGDMPNEPFIAALWHGELLMQPYLYKKVRKKPKIACMISEHFDGEIIAGIIRYFGFESIRGSSTRGSVKVLLKAIKKMREGYDIAITPDGPKGPRHSVADGIIAISKKADAYIVPFRYKASSYWQLKSWDRFIIPKPFSKLTFMASEPFKVTDMESKEAKEYIKKRLSEPF